MKKLAGVLLILILIVGGAAWYFVTYRLDALIEQEIESAGRMALGTSVQVGSVQTSIRDGSLTISNITVANPPGYKNDNAVSFNGIEAAVDYDGFDIKRIVIDNPEVIIEERGGKTNFAEMLAALESGESEPAAADAEAPVITIRHFRMNETRAAFESEALDTYTDLEVDAIELRNLKGTPEEVGKAIATEILKEISSEAAVELLKAQAGKKYKETERQVTDKLKGLLGGGDEDDSDN